MNHPLCVTREQLVAEGKINVPPYSVASEVMKAVHRGNLENTHIPHSDVYFVRAALEKHTGYLFPLDAVEAAMKAEGWRDRRGIGRY
jgi:hypothetical protein